MNAELRARTLRHAYLRLSLMLAPALGVLWLALNGHGAAAVLLFCTVLTTMMIGTLVPRCALFGRMIKRLPAEGNLALLTIDDGPHPEHTPAILDILDQHGIKALFFLVGERAARHPELVREIVVRGHEIGNHTQTHPATTFWMLRPARLWQEIAGCQQTLTALCPEHPPRFFRPPAGHHNAFTALTARALGLRMMLWSARGFDGVLQEVPFITQRIASRLQPGAIVLIHEGTPVAVEVAQAVAAMMKASALKCDTPPASLPFGHHQVAA
ncbi:polysaccharide deacetylase family protein [Prosthecobacter vanneervenii]|uniref:Peptidoglycan/xylan/chitin deacetylase (PgdA/CDA1 family) n=1 Tax=Prosthecobacter vanneervenii TaxID=48466 RepID=A0A7W7YEY3_9BACT|nr:polysaccharide deacetylase family protein [Prosthecobacter vanneervenii]MBB5034951.1 peptidoglycan/xylan/chitin deacetylase (PgdA/CDA1 family) [Prosthecobacter vanneervenii]